MKGNEAGGANPGTSSPNSHTRNPSSRRASQPVSANQLNHLRPANNPMTDSRSGLPSSAQEHGDDDSQVIQSFRVCSMDIPKGLSSFSACQKSSVAGSGIDWRGLHGNHHQALVSFTHSFKASFNLSLCVLIQPFDVLTPFLDSLYI
ncbi:hypothetical protein DPEC_G00043580 [Dallia pectoralis]|uniref:Uncharacterized protein n=1 Tax=Dallia pectoralis TaxID=75939 RepID=A0ACC2H9D2_DALPE|nr:hypothetical protein DPEC_G00043580 [Dallia pectoralis]